MAKHNDQEREQWVMNDEGLYDLWKRSGKGITTFVRTHRKEIDEVIDNVTSGSKPGHYLKYGG